MIKSTNEVLVLGAGSVAPPVVDYLLKQPNIRVVLADQYYERAAGLIKDHPAGKAIGLDIHKDKEMQTAVSTADIVISLLPYIFHPRVAAVCLKFQKHLITASYVTDEIRNMDEQVREAGLLFLNEIGLDPGLDHMEAMRIIDGVRKKKGTVESFVSFCGGLPAPEANDNPFGYKFSWSPRGVLLAGKNPADYLLDGKKVHIPADRLFKKTMDIQIKKIGKLEGYPNRNSLSYIRIYNIPQVKTMLRGTLRYPGWCEFIDMAHSAGLLRENEMDWVGMSCRDFLERVTGIGPSGEIRKKIAAEFDLKPDAVFMQCLDYLSLFSDAPLPLRKGSPLDILVHLMETKLRYKDNERDMITLKHTFTVSYPEGGREKITSTLLDFGIPGGNTAMARTVGLPVAAATKLILQGDIKKSGVHIPVSSDVYLPILEEMKAENIAFEEKTERITL